MAIKFGLDTFGDVQRDDEGNLISAAQTLRNVIAEGVETTAQADHLKKMGVRYHQGYFYSKPLPYDQLAQRSHYDW